MPEGVKVVDEEDVEEEVVEVEVVDVEGIKVVEVEVVDEEDVEEEVVEVEVVGTAALGITRYATAPARTIITITMTAVTVRDMAREAPPFKLLRYKVFDRSRRTIICVLLPIWLIQLSLHCVFDCFHEGFVFRVVV